MRRRLERLQSNCVSKHARRPHNEDQRIGHLAGRDQGRQGRHLDTERCLKEYPYGFGSRFEGKPGTNPEELIGAAHAGCFTMALSLILGEAGLTAERMETKADVTLEQVPDGFALTSVHLTLKARIPGADQARFKELTAKAKAGCPVSRLLKAEITLDAMLEGRALAESLAAIIPRDPTRRGNASATTDRARHLNAIGRLRTPVLLFGGFPCLAGRAVVSSQTLEQAAMAGHEVYDDLILGGG